MFIINKFTYFFIYFSIFSFFGWILESLFRSIFIDKKIVNSGFLYGPFVPIYGFGALFILILSFFLNKLLFIYQLLIYTIIAVLLEYFVSFIFEKILSIKLWDYSKEKFNLNGRICLKFSFFWFLLIYIDLKFIQPHIYNFIIKIKIEILYILTIILLIYFIIDLFVSLKLYLHFIKIINLIVAFNENGLKINIKELFAKKMFIFKNKNFLRPLRQLNNLSETLQKRYISFSKLSLDEIKKMLNSIFENRIKVIKKSKNEI